MKYVRILGLVLSFVGLASFFIDPLTGAAFLLFGLSTFGIGRISV